MKRRERKAVQETAVFVKDAGKILNLFDNEVWKKYILLLEGPNFSLCFCMTFTFLSFWGRGRLFKFIWTKLLAFFFLFSFSHFPFPFPFHSFFTFFFFLNFFYAFLMFCQTDVSEKGRLILCDSCPAAYHTKVCRL